MLAIAIEDIASHVGMGRLLDGESVAPVPAERVANDAGSRRAQHLNPITAVVFDDVRPRDLVVRVQHADVRRRTPKYEYSVLFIVLDDVIDDARKTVLGDFKTSISGVLDGVGVDRRRSSSVDRDAEGAASHGEAFDRHLAAQDLDRWPTCIRCLNRCLALTIEGDALEFGLDQDVLLTGTVHQNDIPGFEPIQDRPHGASFIAIDINRCGTDLTGRGEPKKKENCECHHPSLLGPVHIVSLTMFLRLVGVRLSLFLRPPN